MSELGPSAKRVLADYASVVAPSPADANHNWRDLVRRIERGEPALELGPAPLVRERSRGRTRVGVALSAVAAAAIAVVWLGGRGTVAALETDDRPSAASWQGGSLLVEPAPASVVDHVVVVDDAPRRRSPAPAVRPARAEALVLAPPPVFVPPPAPPAPRRAKPPASRVVADPPPDAASALEQVTAIRKAYAALRDGDADRALRVLDAHVARWPKSEFAGERDLLRVRALCSAGRKSEAERAAATFKRKHRDSPLGAALKQCTGDGPTP